ncbi:MAG: hypothetical protein R6X31_03530 [Anaerolineae bacterium]
MRRGSATLASSTPHQQTPIGDVIRGLMLIYRVLKPRDMHNHVEFL